MAPPAKRRKRNDVQIPTSSSEDEECVSSTRLKTPVVMDQIASSSPVRAPTTTNSVATSTRSSISAPSSGTAQPRAKTANFPSNAAPIYLPKYPSSRSRTSSASVSPEKAKKKVVVEEKGRNGNISALFSKQVQRQKEVKKDLAEAIPVHRASQNTNANILDDISDGDDQVPSFTQSSFVGQAVKKRARGSQTLKNDDADFPSSTQRFMKASQPSAKIVKEEDRHPWAERFAPQNLDELAVHKKKVQDVRIWIDEVMNGQRRQRVLLLKGAAGTGKTTTVQLLAKAMNSEVLEWRNPVGSIDTADGFQSMAAQFEEFLGRGGKFGQLEIFSTKDEVTSIPDLMPLDRRKRLIVVEEFPNTFARTSNALQTFRSTILQYLASNTPPLSLSPNPTSTEPITPVILIVSETLLTTTSASADSFTAHRLLGPEILKHPGVGTIEFNPIAPTLLAKALDLIVQKESRKSGRRKTPGSLVMKALGDVGDIRSAIGSLEFLCLRGDADGDWGAKVAFGKAKRGKEQVMTKMEEESLELVTRREASLGIFHAVGKVVYNKRLPLSGSNPLPNEDVEKLPSYLALHARPRQSEVDLERLIDETGTDTSTFISALHENYILSCDAPPTSFEVSSLDHANGCIDSLSDSDLLCPSWDGSFNSTGFGGGTGGRGSGGDIIRQDEIAFQIAVRGILFSLPYPVNRKASASTNNAMRKGGDQFKMFYPTSLRLWRAQEEIESNIDLWVMRLMKGEDTLSTHSVTSGAAAFSNKTKAGTVESWKSTKPTPASNTPLEEESLQIGLGSSARKEMLLERLPYMLSISKCRHSSTSLNTREMEKVVTFQGIGGAQEDEDDAEEGKDNGEMAGDNWATDKPDDTTGEVRKKRLVMRGRRMNDGGGVTSVTEAEKEMKLVLSDDDIEDD